MGTKPAKIPPAPDPINPAGPIALEALFGSRNISGPYGRQESGYYDADGEWRRANIQDIIGRAFADPQKPNYGALAEILNMETRFQEDPELEAMRRQNWGLIGRQQGLAGSYLNQFEKPGPDSSLPGLLPLSTPASSKYVWVDYDPKKKG